MTEKCTKYESLFIFGNDKDMQEHIKCCSVCKKEDEDMLNVANLVKEVVPYIKRKRQTNTLTIRIAAGFTVLFLSFLIIHFNQINTKSSYMSDSILANEKSVVAQMGLPTDEYGLFVVEE